MFNVEDDLICEGTAQYIKGYLEKYMRKTVWSELKDGIISSYALE
jgi:hypothetical protein